MSSRGIRNRNPGNLRRSADKWQGLAAVQEDREFFTFMTDAHGIRALARTLITYQDKYDLDTVASIITRWAPPTENDTGAYIDHVAKKLGVDQHQPINVQHYKPLRALVEAIILHENGVMPYTDATMRKAMIMAGVDVPVKPIEKSSTLTAGKVAAAGTGASMVVEPIVDMVQQIAPAMPLVETIGNYAPWALGVLVLAAVGWMAWRRIEDQKLRVA